MPKEIRVWEGNASAAPRPRLGASNVWLAWNFFIIQTFLSGAGDDLMAS